MARLPTVKLYKGRNKHQPDQTLIVNTFDYQRNISRYIAAGWKILSVREITPGTTDEAIRQAAREAKVNQVRKEDPTEAAKRGDHRRAYEQRAMRGNIDTEKAASDIAGTAQRLDHALKSGTPTLDQKPVDPTVTDTVTSGAKKETGRKRPAFDPDWAKMPWFSRRKYVADLTGKTPSDADEAAALMADYEKRN